MERRRPHRTIEEIRGKMRGDVHSLLTIVGSYRSLPSQLKEANAARGQAIVSSIVNSSVIERIEASRALTELRIKFPRSVRIVHRLLRETETNKKTQ